MEPVLLYNRQTRAIEEEQIFGATAMKFLFGSGLGFWLTEALLKHRWVTQAYARSQHSPRSQAKIKQFIEGFGINVDEVEHPVTHYRTFNEFFTRRLKPSARPIDPDPRNLISIADGRLLAYEIKEQTIYTVKARSFTIAELFDGALAADYLRRFYGGLCLSFRLAPVDYHRFAYVDDCEQSPVRVINGFYRSVHPFSLRRMKAVFTENQREYCILKTKNFGEVIHIDVGATSVGRIVQNQAQGGTFQRGQEKGYFEFGGSTVLLLLQPGAVQIDDDIANYTAQGIETIVHYGKRIGRQS